MRKPLRSLAIVLLPLALLATACGSDDDTDTPDSTEASDAPDGTTASDDGGDSEGSADVEEFCSQVDDFVEAANKLIEDPTSGDPAAVAQQGQDLAAAANDLIGNIDQDDSDRLTECTDKLSELGS